MTGLDIGIAKHCADITVAAYRGRDIPERLRRHLDWFGSELGTDSQAPQGEWTHDLDLIGVTTAARILRCSERYIRRIATDLDGHRIDGRTWVFHRPTVVAYQEAKTQRGQHDCA